MFTQLLEELAKIGEEIASKIEVSKELEAKVEGLTVQNEELKQEVAELKKEIEEHECPTCNHEEEIEVLKGQVASIEAERNQLQAEHEENTKALQAEIEKLKKILATS